MCSVDAAPGSHRVLGPREGEKKARWRITQVPKDHLFCIWLNSTSPRPACCAPRERGEARHRHARARDAQPGPFRTKVLSIPSARARCSCGSQNRVLSFHQKWHCHGHPYRLASRCFSYMTKQLPGLDIVFSPARHPPARWSCGWQGNVLSFQMTLAWA